MPVVPRPLLALVPVLALLAGGPARAAPVEAATPGATVLSVQAQGEARLAPDRAGLTLGVTAAAATAAAAQQAVARRMTAVVEALHRAGLSGRDLQTASLGLSPQYAYAEGRPARLTGYQASNAVTATVRDLARLPGVLDAATAAGADEVRGPDFGLADPQAAADAARRRAVEKLQAQAALYARAAGLRVVRLASLTETGTATPDAPRPMMFARAALAKAATPVEAGEVVVRVDVSATYELAR